MNEFFHCIREEIEWGGRPFILETGKVARHADGAVMAQYGDTIVLCTAVIARNANPETSFFPLTVHYKEKTFSVGRIPGGFFKRESKPTEKEVLTSRLIDRPIRPLFAEQFTHEVQVICTVLSHDLVNDPDMVALIGASAALSLSGAPFLGPLGAARVGYQEGGYILNPTQTELKNSHLDLVIAGISSGVLMVESEAKELDEDTMLGAVNFGFQSFQPVIEMIDRLKVRVGRPPIPYMSKGPEIEKILPAMRKLIEKDLRKAYALPHKAERYSHIHSAKEKVLTAFKEKVVHESAISSAFEEIKSTILRGDILKKGKRLDGRDLKTVRPIDVDVGILPRAHGSALFTRGETQALVVTTLGTGQDEQIIDALDGEYREHFLLHYDFPPYSVNETGRVGAPGRREIGHGKLAWRALHPLLPKKALFPYTIRVASEITESNGSSSMATVCGASLALMDAGVPLIRPVAGIAMGLIKEKEDFAVLTDILGDEDHLGDMDFKVAGTDQGITALQMDIKITSITPAIMHMALDQAREARLHILKEMSHSIQNARTDVSTHAPKMISLTIPRDKIRDIIGPGGKVIREISETTGARIEINDDGTVNISANDSAGIEAATSAIQAIAYEPEIGSVYTGKVVSIRDFGAFVNFSGNRDGLVHISELSETRVKFVGDVVKVGQSVKVRMIGFDERGKVKLSMRGFKKESEAKEEKEK